MAQSLGRSIFLAIFWILYGIQSFALDSGYIQDIKAEKDEKYEEIFLFSEPAPLKTSYQDKIFNPELTKEFRRKYIEQFGSIDTDSLNYRDPSYAGFADDHSQPLNTPADVTARANFGQYMVKRLTEWHVDHFVKEDPQMRPIYEAKEKLSHLEAKINPETKVEAQYDLSANTLDVKLINPYMDSKVTVYMDPSSFGPSTNTENKLWLGKQLNKKTRVNITATANDGIATLEFLRTIRGNLSTNILSSTFFKDSGVSVRETRTAVGLSNSF